MKPGEIVAIRPWDEFKLCPKCGHTNIGVCKYIESNEFLPEHLLITCVICSYLYRMATKS